MTQDNPIARSEALCLWCDRLVSAGIVCLIGFTPLAFGAVHPWAFCLMEAVIFLLLALWMAKLLLKRDWVVMPRAAAPMMLVIAVIAFQLVRLPLPVVRMLSPATSAIYVKALADWPDNAQVELSAHVSPRLVQNVAVLPTVEEVRQGAPVPFGPTTEGNIPDQDSSGPSKRAINVSARYSSRSWPLSIAPSLTRTALLKLLAYAGLFLLVVKYPFGRSGIDDERRFCRLVVVAALSTGLVVAVVALLQWSWWNGKLFGFFVPYDWGTARPEIRHSGGPFVDPDHLANYLAMIFPLALAGAIWRNAIMPGSWRVAFRILCSAGVIIMWSALLLSLSRAGWIGALVGCVVLVSIVRLRFENVPAGCLIEPVKAPALVAAVAGLFAVTIIALLLIGSGGRSRLDSRLEETLVHETSLGERVVLWEDSLGMVRDFPVLGVGLGCWSELFPHYHRPPWRSGRFVETHNDYLQLATETGLAGFALLAWFFFHSLLRLFARDRLIAPSVRMTFAALVAGVAATAAHEFFDFNLQIPANALLFTVILLSLA